ncbi:PRELI domain containing protein 3A-like [Hydra vulgaris]|uniref:PRELI domain containing protein 3A-like n=1 Tax=Hydra vulgaris TaxID=6087 RepID=A0ABM4DPE9_HYDVU
MKLWSTEHVFSHPWKQVTEAAWRKYPNELNPNVLAIDVLDRNVLEDGRLVTTRIFGTQWIFPKVITTLLGMPEMCYAIESSEVDMKNEKMTLKMINYTFWGILAVEEKLVYQPNKENPNETRLTQGAKIQINGLQFANYFEGVIAKNFESTSIKGRTALEQVLHKIKIENFYLTLAKKIEELSLDIDKAATFIDEELSVTERIKELTDDLDKASSIINSEVKHFSTKIQNDLKHLFNDLNADLHEIQKTVVVRDTNPRSSLVAAVQQAGITAKSNTNN